MASPAARPTSLLHQFAIFSVVGAIATLIHYAILIALVEFGSTSPIIGSAVGYSVSVLVNYALNYRFTFRSSSRHRSALPRFLIVALVGLALNSTIMWVAFGLAKAHYLLAQVLATSLVLLWNFAANRRWSFQP